MSAYLSTADHAARIRGELKTRHKITSRQVSVRADNYSMGSAIRIRISDPTVSRALVEAIARPAESIDRDQWGEILSGGNRFVDVSYTTEALDSIGARYLAVVEAAATALEAASASGLIPIAGTPFLLGRPAQWASGFSLWEGGDTGGHLEQAHELGSIARAVGCRMLERGVRRPPRVETTPPRLTLVPPAPVAVPHTYGCQAGAALLGQGCICGAP